MTNIFLSRKKLVAIFILIAALFIVFSFSITSRGQFSSAPIASGAAVDYFLKLDGIDGESTDKGHGGEIDIESWSWGMSNPSSTTGGGGGAGKVTAQDFHFTHLIDKASPKLMLACASGQHIKEAKLTVRNSSGDDYLTIKFSDVFCTSFQDSGSGGQLPTEQVSLNFAKVEFEYKPQGKNTAPLRSSWDFRSNRQTGGVVETPTDTVQE